MTFKRIKTRHMVRTSNGDAKCTKALSERIQIFAKNDIKKLNLIVKEYFNFFIGKLYTTHEPWTHNLTLHSASWTYRPFKPPPKAPLVKGLPNSNNILYNITFSSEKKIKIKIKRFVSHTEVTWSLIPSPNLLACRRKDPITKSFSLQKKRLQKAEIFSLQKKRLLKVERKDK